MADAGRVLDEASPAAFDHPRREVADHAHCRYDVGVVGAHPVGGLDVEEAGRRGLSRVPATGVVEHDVGTAELGVDLRVHGGGFVVVGQITHHDDGGPPGGSDLGTDLLGTLGVAPVHGDERALGREQRRGRRCRCRSCYR